ncbi:hypothetical protein [uncultured Sulfitobacter sp.]|uniref:hypothetical protein n=1 Tax=uncultured Sulfitobacter sp. TaxID=191468 RepID=UPI002611AEE2|nr:hypothetical protein [uncultured Sulfitobacter sp.]
MRVLPVFTFVLILAACGDPLAGIGRLSDVDVPPEDAASAAALPDAEEVAREGFIGTSAAEGEVPAAVDTGVPTETDSTQAEAAAAPAGGGFLRGLIRRAANADPAAAVAADVAAAQSDQVVIETTPTTSANAAETATETEEVQLAALPAPEVSPREELQPRRRGIGLFGGSAAARGNAPRTGPDQRDVPYGTVLAFGEIARVCEARGKALGKKLGSTGRRGFTLHDSKPGVRDKRTFYVTGFGDNCPRQFTAANALFGAPSFYEQIRFSPAGKHLPYAATDKAYDKVKTKVCRTGKNKPCGGQIGKLDAAAAFVSAYEFHEHNNKWKEFFVSDGAVLAGAVKSAN